MSAAAPAKPTQNRNDIAAEVASLVEAIDVYTPKSILEFGAQVGERTNHYTDAILSRARSLDLGETGKQLNEIVLLAQDFDLSALDNPWGQLPIVGSLVKGLLHSKSKMIARFENVKGQVEKLVASVESTAVRLQQNDANYQEMYQGVRQEYDSLALHVEAVKHKLSQLREEIAALRATDSEMSSLERLAVLESAEKTLAKRGDDLVVLQHAAMQTLPMIRILQANNLAIIDKFTTIRTLTLPAWKRAFLLALSLNEQKDAVELAESIDNATNALMRRNAELLRQNSVAIAKSNQRLVIDVETLKTVHANILDTLKDVRQVHRDGEVSRATALKELEKMRVEMAGGVKAIELRD